MFYANNFNFNSDQVPPILPETKMFFYIAFYELQKQNLHKTCELSVIGQIRYSAT